MLTCVRWHVAYPLSLRHVEEMMQERGVFVDHSTVHRWAIKMVPVLAAIFRSRKRPVGSSWRMDETYTTWLASGSTCTALLTALATRWTSCLPSSVMRLRRGVFWSVP